MEDMAKAAGLPNKVYPATDVEDGVSNGNVGPGNLHSGDENSVEGKYRSKIRVVGDKLDDTGLHKTDVNTIDQT